MNQLTLVAITALVALATGSEVTQEIGKQCWDGKDNDRDGKADCRDSDCAKKYVQYCKRMTDGKETGRECFDGKDNDDDGKKDCQDSDCLRDRRVAQRCKMLANQNKHDNPHTETARECMDHRDNDGDGKTDCEDPDCLNGRRTQGYCRRMNHGQKPNTGSAQCTLGSIMNLALSCSDANANDKAFCQSTCYKKLDPFLKSCKNSNAMRSGKQMIALASQLTTQCDDKETGRECFDGKDNDGDGKKDCDDPDCLKNRRIRQYCQRKGGGSSSSSGGTGSQSSCSMIHITGACSSNPANAKARCDARCIKAIDVMQRPCKVNKQFETTWVPVMQKCLDTGAGDGVCNVLGKAMASCTAFQQSDPDYKDPKVCKHPCVQEAFDCIDNKALANIHDEVVELKASCSTKTMECESIMNDMGKTFAPLCCPNHNADCNRGPPKTCNKQCAQLFVPFFDKCANAIIKAGMDNNGELAAFADKCAGVH